MSEFSEQAIQIVGAILILVAYISAQLKYVAQDSISYLLANLVGSAILAVLALIDSQWGFLLLEAVWAVVSAISLARVMIRHWRA